MLSPSLWACFSFLSIYQFNLQENTVQKVAFEQPEAPREMEAQHTVLFRQMDLFCNSKLTAYSILNVF